MTSWLSSPRVPGLVSALLLSAVLTVPAYAAVPSGQSPVPLVAEDAWSWPLSPQPTVEHFFDAPDGPYAAGHRGVDLLGRVGQAVRAVDEGTVAYAGRVGGIGVVSMDTTAGRVTYQPVIASVRRGDVVDAGTVLGRLLVTGGHCLPRACLHLGLIAGGEYQDPLRLLGGGPVRLLPLNEPLLRQIAQAPQSPVAQVGTSTAVVAAAGALTSWRVGASVTPSGGAQPEAIRSTGGLRVSHARG